MKKNFLKILPVVLLALAIGFSPSFSAGTIAGGMALEIRVEDILIVLLGLIWIGNILISARTKIERPPLFFPILAWVSVSLFSVLINWLFANLSLSQGFFFFLKEVELFFLYFYVFYHITTYNQAKTLLKIWIFIGLVNVGWIVYELITGLQLTYHYGPTPFIEPEGPLPAGVFFLMIFIFLFNVFLFYYLNQKGSKLKKGALSLVITAPILGLISSGSRASFFGLIFALILTFSLYFLKKGFAKSLLIVLLVSILGAAIFFLISPKIPRLGRLLDKESFLFEFNAKYSSSRMTIWKDQFSEMAKHPLFLFFGFGKSFLLAGHQSHNQYLKNLSETGIVGSLMFFYLIFVILKKSFLGFMSEKEPLARGLSAGLFVATGAMLLISIGGEAFLVVKPNEVYWFFAALTMVVLGFTGKESSKINDPALKPYK